MSDTEAVLYLYATNNGYASYTLTIDPEVPYVRSIPLPESAVEEVGVEKVSVNKVIENAQVYIIKNGVKYNILGAVVK